MQQTPCVRLWPSFAGSLSEQRMARPTRSMTLKSEACLTTVPALGFQIHGFHKYFSSNDIDEYDVKIEENAKCVLFYLFCK